jgi:hypothetical protein
MLTRVPGALSLLLLSANGVSAAAIVVQPTPSVDATAVIDRITGADMVGLVVTAIYQNPADGTRTVGMTWAATGPTAGAARSEGDQEPPRVSISLTGDTSGPLAWQYTSMFLSPLVSLEFDGTAAGILFDRSSPDPGTPASGSGLDITFSALVPPGVENAVLVVYGGAVGVGGAPPSNDLFARMLIDFSQIHSAGVPGLPPQDFSFSQDTDLAVPEPATALLVAGGLLFVRWSRQRVREG